MGPDSDVKAIAQPRLLYRSRLLALLVVVAAVGTPAVVLRALCVGHSCDEEADASSEVPFCSLPEDVRRSMANGFRKGRSPEVLAVTGATRVAGKSVGDPAPSFVWPATQEAGAERVPIAFYGPGIQRARLPAGTGLDDIAPTLAESIQLHRKFPEVRSGRALDGIVPSEPPILVVTIALEGIGSADIQTGRWTTLDRILADGATTTDGSTEAIPLDPAGTGLDDIAPTLAESIRLHRKFPEVRSGRALDGIVPSEPPILVVTIALEGIGSADIQTGRWTTLDRILADGATTTDGSTEAIPLDPAASLVTIGTGGMPSQHGIVGEIIRNDEGRLVRTGSKEAPVSVIATLGDDLDETLNQRPVIGVAGSGSEDRGLIGGNWYVDVDRDVASLDEDPGRAAVEMLQRDFGRDDVPDLLGVALRGHPNEMDEDLSAVIEAAADASDDRYVVAIAGTGSLSLPPNDRVAAARVVRKVEDGVPEPRHIVEAAGASGLYLDQDALLETGLSEDAAIDALEDVRAGGRRLVVDSFPSIAVSFSRYC